VRLFLDSTVLLAASGSSAGASREIFNRAPSNKWDLIATPYVLEEVLRNLSKLPATSSADWATLRPRLLVMDDVLSIDRPVVFDAAKDRPILFSALAWADVLLTLDRHDFGQLIDSEFYGLSVLTPGGFLEQERAAGQLR
jgi:hypothetical protein